MSAHAFPVADARTVTDIVLACHDTRAPSAVEWAAGTLTLTFTPDLSAAEATAVELVVTAAASAVRLTPAEYDAIRPNLQALRDLRQLGRNAFLALTAAERDRRLYDAQTDTTVILLALLRG